jgi:lysophospholipase L1-like esterase
MGEHNILYSQGIPGDTSTNLVKRIKTEIRSRTKHFWPSDYHIAIIAIGTNDSRINTKNHKPETPEDKFWANINKCISYAKKYADKTLLIGITPVDDKKTNPYEGYNYTNSNIKRYNGILKKIATKHKVPFLDYHSYLMKEGFIKHLRDGIHPDTKGHNILFKHIYDFILKNKILGDE